MPELPEVELYARYFAQHALGQKIRRVHVLDARVVGSRNLAALRGRTFRRVSRHGKHLFAEAKGLWLHIHFGMTGDLSYFRDEPPRFARVIFDFDNGARLAYEDMRLFGAVDLTPSPEDYVREHELGPDPLEIGLRGFRRLIAGRRGRIKALLMSQHVLAGVGNLYADEALYRSSIDPRRPASSLGDAVVRRLFVSLRGVLREAIDFKSRGRDYPVRFLIPHRVEGERCPRCGGEIRRTIVAGRTTYYCGTHQE